MKTDKKLIERLWLSSLIPLIVLALLAGCQPQEPDDDTSDGDDTTDPVEEGEYRLDSVNVFDLRGTEQAPRYQARGVGGGGAMSGFSQSPYSSLWFVGTDMGTLFRSIDWGKTWWPVFHSETIFSSNLDHSPGVGFFSDGSTVLHAVGGMNPQVSYDSGKTWEASSLNLSSNEYIESWYGDSYDENTLFALTTTSLWVTSNKGQSWQRILNEAPKGLHLDYLNRAPASVDVGDMTTEVERELIVIYTATQSGVFQSRDRGNSWTKVYAPASNLKIRKFAAGRDKNGLTLTFADDQGSQACSNAAAYLNDWGSNSLAAHYEHCGFLWVSPQNTQTAQFEFTKTQQKVGDHLKMAENDSSTIVVTGSTAWIRQYGTKVWMSEDAGDQFTKIFQQIDWDVVPFAPWPAAQMDYSAVALDIGWYDNGYVSFSMNQRNSSEFGGTGFFFLHSSRNKGDFWDAPFTNYQGSGTPSKNDQWRSTGLEVTTVYRLKFHPENSNLAYAAMADVSGMVSQDGGQTFQLTSTGQNSIYDFAFDRYNDQVVYAVSGGEHDFPIAWHANATKSIGGVFKSINRGISWQRLTPTTDSYNRQFLSLGFDSDRGILYAGSQSLGVARSADGGASWSYFNNGLPAGNLIIPQIEVDPANGDVYALVTGNAPDFTNSDKTGIYKLAAGSSQWQHLRGTVQRPSGVTGNLWYYPTAFAIDFSGPGDRSTLYMVDYENNRNWLASGVWKSIDGGDHWERTQQYTHPLGIKIDPNDSNRVYVGGLYQLDGNWGEGGALYSNDGGETWQENEDIPYQINGRSITIDPNNSANVFYAFFGSGLLYGERPQ